MTNFHFIDQALAAEERGEVVAMETQTSEHGGVLANLGINGSIFAAQLINFLLVVAVIWFLILKPITKKMTERQNLIDESLNNAEKIKNQLVQSEADYNARLEEAKQAGRKVMEKATQDAEIEAQALKDKSKQEIQSLVEQAKVRIQAEKEEMVQALKSETANMVVSALEKILSQKIDAPTDKKIIEDMLKKMPYEKNN